MSGKRFFVNKIEGDRAEISGEDFDHAVIVLRHKQGDRITVFNYAHGEFSAEITAVNPKEKIISLTIKEKLRGREISTVKIGAIISIIKKDNMELALKKLTELGVDEIIPVITKRTVVKIKEEEKKSARWEKIIYEAVKQCGRVTKPVLKEPVALKELKVNKNAVKFLIWEKETERFLIDEAAGIQAGEVYFFTGPEGGFDGSEVEQLKKEGFITVSLGDTTLRAETAAIVSAGVMAQYYRRAGVGKF